MSQNGINRGIEFYERLGAKIDPGLARISDVGEVVSGFGCVLAVAAVAARSAVRVNAPASLIGRRLQWLDARSAAYFSRAIISYCPSTQAKIKGTQIVASLSTTNFGVEAASLPQVIFSFGTAPE